MTAAQHKYLPHYTYDDYVQWEGRWELINGIPYAMSPAPIMFHQRINANITSELKVQLKNCPSCKVYYFIDFKIGDDIVLQPDASVVCEPFVEASFLTKAPEIVFEILSPSTKQKDLHAKYDIYEKAGVKYYVIVDPVKRQCFVYHLTEGIYKLVFTTETGKFEFGIEGCPIEFDFGTIW
jgi:Uma2 family endonuclease